MERLKYLSNATVDQLRESISANADRYRSGDFTDLMRDGDWSIELPLEVNTEKLSHLDPAKTPEAEVSNSRLVWESLPGLTPALACEEGIWVRLSHIECLEFARGRWLSTEMDDEQAVKAVTDHFFANTLGRRRDDHAVARLWWNAHVASLAAPGGDLPALSVMLRKADLRSNFVERSLTVSRPVLAAGLIRVMQRNPQVTAREEDFRAFMRAVNRLGGGIVFEAMNEAQIDAFMDRCAASAGISVQIAA